MTNDESEALVSRKDERPRYLRIRDALQSRIAEGEWKAGDSLPSEQALSVEYGVAQGTLRKAIDLLVSEGRLFRRHGIGTFVSTYDGARMLSHLLRLVDAHGNRDIPTARTVSHVKDVASPEEKRRLNLKGGAKIIRIERVRSFGELPIIFERLALPRSMFPDLLPNKNSELPAHLYEKFWQRYGILVRGAVEHLRAVAASSAEAALLHVESGSPLLEIDRMIHSVEGRPIEWRISRCLTKYHSYRSETMT